MLTLSLRKPSLPTTRLITTKERWSDGKDPAAFIKTGLDAAGESGGFEAALKEPAVQETLEKWKASYDVAKIRGVPAYVVNGKYLIYTKSINHRRDGRPYP